ncbi:MAG: hypothetical protein IJ561_00175 [Ruminococcus sp.]|nr:hypothetical protein [Ruminococcus sp.]
MKSRGFNIFFRIVLIVTFFAGMVFLISFIRLVDSPAVMTEEQFLSACRRWTYTFIVYLFLCVGSSVLSILCFRSNGKIVSIARTAVIVFAAVADLLAMRYIFVFRGYEDAVEAAKAVDDLLDKGTVFIIMSFVGAMLLFFLMVSSVYNIVKISRDDEFNKVVDPTKPPEEQIKKKQ